LHCSTRQASPCLRALHLLRLVQSHPRLFVTSAMNQRLKRQRPLSQL